MIVFIIDVQYLVALDPEGKAPIASDMQAPDSLPISGKQVRFPEGKGAQFFPVLQVEPFQTLVDEAPKCSLVIL